MAVDLHLNLITSTSTLPARAGVRLLYVLLETSASSPQIQPAPLHCCLVVDCSPSMRVPVADETMFRELMRRGLANEVMLDGLPVWQISGGIPADLKGRAHSPSRWVIQAVGGAAERLEPRDRLSIIAFADAAQPVVNHHTPSAGSTLRSAIAQLERGDFGQHTRLAPALQLALDLLQSNHTPARSDRVLVLTDGFVEDEAACLELAGRFGAAQIPISTLGLGIEFQEQLLLALADHSGGNALLLRDPQSIPGILQRELGRASRVIANRARLDLRLAQGVELRRIYRVRPALAELSRPPLVNRAGQVPLGALERHSGGAILLELLAPPHPDGEFRLLRASFSADDPDGVALPPASRELVVRYATGAVETIDPALQPLIERLAAWRLQTQALAAAAQGDTAGATLQLQAAVTRLIDLGEHELAAQTAATADQLAATGSVEPGQAKALRYATRRLTDDG
ncbi:MAG: VWA domain-containing protein [Herpetosiphonaceae bacterium]|nr:VWA domain-containing protein [Herpetosiphonaceae bacterium]